jgi:hypothetical protein
MVPFLQSTLIVSQLTAIEIKATAMVHAHRYVLEYSEYSSTYTSEHSSTYMCTYVRTYHGTRVLRTYMSALFQSESCDITLPYRTYACVLGECTAAEGTNAGQHTPTLSLPPSHHCLNGEVPRESPQQYCTILVPLDQWCLASYGNVQIGSYHGTRVLWHRVNVYEHLAYNFLIGKGHICAMRSTYGTRVPYVHVYHGTHACT